MGRASRTSKGEAFPATHAVFHDPGLFERELAALYEGGWFFLGAGELLDEGGLSCPAGERLYRACGERAWREDAPSQALRLERAGPFAFAAGAGAKGSLGDYLGPQRALLESFELGTFLFAERERVRANWKLVVGGAVEDYHVPHVHPGAIDAHRQAPAAPRLHPRGHSSYATPAALSGVLALAHRALTGGPPPRLEFQNHLVFPNLLAIRLWGLVHVTRFVPLRPDLTERWTRVYTQRGAPALGTRVAQALLVPWIRRGFRRTFAEDRAVVEAAQEGSGLVQWRPRGPAHAEEARVEHLLDAVAARLAAP